MIISRRTSLMGLGGAALWTTLAPGLAFANVATDRRFVFVFLRGGMDALSAVPAYGEPNFKAIRGKLADGNPGEGTPFDSLKLNGLFALNPDLKAMHGLYHNGELLVVHATCHGYRGRSHFDAQDAFDRGTIDKAVNSGWLNRALQTLPADFKSGRDNVAMGIGPTLPFSLRGSETVGSWSPPSAPNAPPDTLERLAALYKRDKELWPPLEKGLSASAMGASMGDMDMKGQGFGSAASFVENSKVAASFLNAPNGPRLVTLDYGNWDSHSDQNGRYIPGPNNSNYAGRYAEFYLGLDRGVAALKAGMKPDVWSQTAIVVVTEFGRAVKINGTAGTDHGTGGAAFLLGGAVKGGRVIADWAGLKEADLFEGRDLKTTTDTRALIKGVLREHLAVSDAALNDTIFPESKQIAPVEGLIRT